MRPADLDSDGPWSPTFTIAHLSDIHCGDPHFVPDLMERAIADINELEPDIVVCSGDLTTYGFKEEYVQAKRYLDRLECESFVVIPGNHDSRNVGYVHFEELFGAAQLGAAEGAASRSSPSTRPSPTSTTARSAAAATAGSRRSSPSRRDLRVFVLHHHLLPVPGTGPRAERRLRRRRRDRVPAARRCESRALRAQARSLCVAAREPVRRQHRAPSRRSACAGTRGPVTTWSRSAASHVAVWRRYPFHGPGADHPVRPRDARVREVHRADRERGDGASGDERRSR